MAVKLFRTSVAIVALLLCGPGCDGKPQGKEAETHSDHDGHDHGAHEHAAVGPHGGELVELGEEEYHAEVVHAKDVTVYVLDSAAKAPVAIDATEVVLNVTHDGKSEQFQLAAAADAGDAAGKSSRFQSSDAELASDLQEGHADVQLVLTINGTQFRGALEHEHEDGHQH